MSAPILVAAGGVNRDGSAIPPIWRDCGTITAARRHRRPNYRRFGICDDCQRIENRSRSEARRRRRARKLSGNAESLQDRVERLLLAAQADDTESAALAVEAITAIHADAKNAARRLKDLHAREVADLTSQIEQLSARAVGLENAAQLLARHLDRHGLSRLTGEPKAAR